MIYVDPASALLALITLLFIGFYNGFKTKRKENILKQIERDYKNNPNKIFDLKDYPSLTYADLVNHFGKDEVNLIKG